MCDNCIAFIIYHCQVQLSTMLATTLGIGQTLETITTIVQDQSHHWILAMAKISIPSIMIAALPLEMLQELGVLFQVQHMLTSSNHCKHLTDDDTDVDDCSPNGAVRLVDGNATEGRVEYCYNGQWSAICRTFHDEEIAVTCRQLGFSPYGGTMINAV